MAEYLSARTRVWRMAAAISAAMLTVAFADAQELRDPTRPPALFESDGGQRTSSASAGPVLQSVLISPTRRIAMIDGQALKPGDKFGDARVVKITENEVVLRNGQEVQTLKLFPQVEKQKTPHPKLSHAGSRQPSR
jgi:MSHA biogenesis protein MshK